MPQGPRELHEKWQDDGNALTHLLDRRGFRCRWGIILQPQGHTNSDEDESAIAYLCMEWDYGYQPARYEDKDEMVQPDSPEPTP